MSHAGLAVLRRSAREIAAAVLDLIAPRSCAACGALAASALCGACESALERRPRPACSRCGEAVLAPGAACPADHDWLRGIVALHAPWRYRGAAGAIVRRFKFEGDAAAGDALVRGLAEALRGAATGVGRRALVVPVPMHKRARRARGFDQAERLAIGVAHELGLGFGGGVLRRLRATLSQTDPRVTSREQNVAGAFVVARPRVIHGRTILLVDDVVTSGATARACAAALRAAGARAVIAGAAALG